jgi:hypothetical protein
MLQTSSLRAGVALLVALPLASLPVRAVPFGGVDTFDKAPLDPSVWRWESPLADAVKVEGGRLVFKSDARDGLLVRRFYPLQSEGVRPDMGNFRVAMRLSTMVDSRDGISLGLQSPDGTWRLQLHIGSGLRWGDLSIPQAPDSKLKVTGEVWGQQPDPNLSFIPDTFELVRQGRTIEARISIGDKTQTIGHYRGDLPPIMEVWLRRDPRLGFIELSPFPHREGAGGSPGGPGGFGTPEPPLPVPPSLTRSENDEIAIDELRIEPLPESIAYSQVLARTYSQELARWEPEAAFRTGGGMVPLSPGKPAASIKIGSLQSKPVALTLKTWVEDGRRRVVWKRDVPISLAPRQEKTISLPLPADRAGYFILYRQLVDKKGNVIELLEGTSFEIKPAIPAGAK